MKQNLDFLIGSLAGLVGLMGLLLSNGLLAAGFAWSGEFAAIALACAMAVLGSTLGGRPFSWRSGAAVASTALFAWLLAGPNPTYDLAFGIDQNSLIPRQMALLGGPPPWECGLGTLIVVIFAACSGGALASLLLTRRRALVYGLLALVLISFFGAAATMNPQIYVDTATPPLPHQYVMDGFLWLRMHDLMQQGQSYYPAFYTAYVDRLGETGTPGYWTHWRPPVLFWLWRFVPGGPQGLLVAFWMLSLATLAASFGAMKKLVEPALALWAPVLLGAYLLYGADTMWFPSQEWWGSSFMILGIWAFLSDSPAIGSALWALAATSREHFCFLLGILALRAWFKGRRDRIWAGLAFLLVFLVYGLHYGYVYAAHYYDPSSSGLQGWRSPDSDNPWKRLEFIERCLQFATVYLAGRQFLLFPLLGMGMAGALLCRERSNRIMLAGVILAPLAAYLASGQLTRWYWGTVLVPQLLLCVPLVVSRLPGCQAAQGPKPPPA